MSRKLRTLLKKNRQIEETIFYEPRITDWRKDAITPQELSEALKLLSAKIKANQSTDMSILSMLNEIDFLTGRPLASFEKNALQTVEILFNYLRFNTGFKKRYFSILNDFQIVFTRLALGDLSFLDNHKHPAVVFLERLTNTSYMFDASAGKLVRYFMHAMELLLGKLVAKDDISAKTFNMANNKMKEYLAGFEEKVELNTSKVISQIDKKSRNAQADFYTEQLIKSKIEGEEIAIFLLDFFENQLTSVVHKVIMNYGVQSKECQQLLTDMDAISWSVSCSFSDPTYQTRFDSDVAPALKRIYHYFTQFGLSDEYVDSFFIEIEQLHKDKLEGKRIDLDMMISADIFGDDIYETEPVQSWDEPPKPSSKFSLNQLNEGDYYLLTINQQKLRCRLIMINDLTEGLYFVNTSGELVKTVSFEDSKFLNECLEMYIQEEPIYFRHSIKALEIELQSKLSVLETELEKINTQAAKDEEQKEQLEAKARQAVLERLEEEKRQIDKKRQQLIDDKKREQQAIIEKEKQDAARRFKAKGILRKLGPGSEVAIMLENDIWTDASLMIISKTTDRYIFANSRGAKVFEPTKDELIDCINRNHIKVLQSKPNLNDPLQSLVARRREILSDRQ